MIGNIESQKIVEELLNRETISICLSGPEGIGKKTKVLEIIGKILNVNTKEAVFHADLFFVEPQNNIIKLEKIRELIKFSYLKSFFGARKFVIIDDANLMNIESQNALLKIIEDPPIGESIILITNKYEELLPTIRSRVINVKFKKLKDEEINTIIGKNLSSEILALADGSISKAKKYLNYDMSMLSQFVEAILHRNSLAFNSDFEKEEFETLSRYAICVLKEMRRIAVGYDSNLYDARTFYSKLKLDVDTIDKLILKLDESMNLYNGNFNKKSILADLFLGNI